MGSAMASEHETSAVAPGDAHSTPGAAASAGARRDGHGTAPGGGGAAAGAPGRRGGGARPAWWRELLLIVAVYGVYSAIRGAVPTNEALALANAADILALEQLLLLDIERAVNAHANDVTWFAVAIGWFYGTLHFVATPAVLVWVWVRRPSSYLHVRRLLAVTTVIGLCVYWIYPLAPPRFAMPGIVDTTAHHDILGAGSGAGVSAVANPYAAMPSMHVAWAVWCALAVVIAVQAGRLRHLAWIYPALTTYVVVATGNHFVLDIVGAFAALALAGGLLTLAQRPAAWFAPARVEIPSQGA